MSHPEITKLTRIANYLKVTPGKIDINKENVSNYLRYNLKSTSICFTCFDCNLQFHVFYYQFRYHAVH